MVTCEQVGNAGYPETGPTEILEPAGVLRGRKYPEERIPAHGRQYVWTSEMIGGIR